MFIARNAIFICCICTLVFIVGIFYATERPSKQELTAALPAEKIKTLRARFFANIESVGFESAYKDLQKTYTPRSFIGHAVDHYAGDYLYKAYGIKGLAYCGDAFTGGCMHQIINQVFATKTIAAVDDIVLSCRSLDISRQKGCIHGLGHAILEFGGRGDVIGALDRCAKIDGTIKPHGCVGGVYMEYFFPSVYEVVSDASFQIWPYEQSNPYDRCFDLPSRFQETCVYSLVEWWEVVFEHDYEHIIPLCANIKTQNLRKVCFAALGSVITYYTSYDVGKSTKVCDLVLSSDERQWCRAGIGWLLEANNKKKQSDVEKQVCYEDSISYKICLQSIEEFRSQF
jgi:hypothetical protein